MHAACTGQYRFFPQTTVLSVDTFAPGDIWQPKDIRDYYE